MSEKTMQHGSDGKNASEQVTDQIDEQRRVQVLVLGGGPGGYSCAIRAAQLGLDVLLVESQRTGGTCLHAGCIPSKALIHAAQRYGESVDSKSPASTLGSMGICAPATELDWSATQRWKDGIVEQLANGVEGLLARAGVQVLNGHGQMLDGKRCLVRLDATTNNPSVNIEIVASHVVLAMGAEEVTLPQLPSGDCVLYARQALALEQLPEHLAVVGGGYIGLELGQAFARLGVSVSVVEACDRLLPAYPKALVAPLSKVLRAQGVQILCETLAGDWAEGFLTVSSARADGAHCDPVRADMVLVAVGRKANLEGWGREQLALDLADGFIAVDARGETSMSGVFAVGDITGEPMLAHRAIAQGRVAAECLAGRRRQFAPVAIPAVCFTSPEIATVGETAASARAAGLDVLVQRIPLLANGRALTLGQPAGFVEVVAARDDHALLGVQAVGEHVAELVHSFALALEMGARLEDIADTIHAHPTLGESFADACLAALGSGESTRETIREEA